MNGIRAPRRMWAAAALFLGLLLATNVALAERREGQPFHWNGRLSSGSTLEIHGVNGQIEVTPSTGGETTVDAEKWSRHGDPDRVRIQVEEGRGSLVIREVYPHSWFNFGSENVDVHFTVHVPAGVILRLSTVNGAIEGEDLDNRVVAHTVNGGVHVDTARDAEAQTVNGSIVIRATPRNSDLHFHSVNGSVRLEIPVRASVRLSAHTLNGWIQSDFPGARTRSGFIGRSYDAQVGSGEAQLDVSTVNGSIRVTRI